MQKIIKKLLILSLLLNTFLFAGFASALKKQTFLKPEEAFQISAVQNGVVIDVSILLAEKIHIYQNSLKFRIVSPQTVDLHPSLPKAHLSGGEAVYEGTLEVEIPVSQITSKVKGDYTLEVELLGCSDSGICYQPFHRSFTFQGEEAGLFDRLSSLAQSGNTDRIADALANESWSFILLLFFAAGLLMALTPCILPMIPILSSIILQQANREGEVKRSTAVTISAVYVLSMALMYAVIGVVAGLMDFDLQAQMNNPWVILPVAAIFVALALSLFGYFELALPLSWQTRLNRISDNAHGKGLIGTAVMGALSALIVGACTAPIISGAILFIMLTGKALLGGMALFVMGIGAGVPLLLVGAGASRFVPKPGGWMSMVSKFFGIVMLVMALLMLSRLLPGTDAGERGYSVARLEKEVAATDKPVIVDIYKAGCAACKELEEMTFPDPAVKKELERFTFIHIDVTGYTEADKALLKKYQLFGAPNIIFFDRQNRFLPQMSLTGFIKPEDFAKHLKAVAK